jgi:hypothetical protein
MNSALNLSREPSVPVIALDGAESVQGRALFVISALYWCARWLSQVEVRLIDVVNEDVVLAAAVFEADTGNKLTIYRPFQLGSPLEGSDLYAAAAFRSASHLRLAEAHLAKIPVMMALQFPEPGFVNSSIFMQKAAFDPKIFAERLYTTVESWI